MEIKVRPISIDSDNPFSTDCLQRENEVETLTGLIFNIDTPVVMSINAEWGTGKTTFIKMWSAYLKNKGTFSLYFNAWETDFADDPLIAFLGEMNSSLEELLSEKGERKELWNKTKKVGTHVAKRAIPLLVKFGTAGIIDADQIVEKEISTFTESLTKDAVQSYLETKKSINDFKENLHKFISSISTDNEEQKTPIVIFVDELDRCRPTYALELLERIKHILDIEGLIFVLSLDKNQLGHSVKAVYGEGLDSVGYLRRFIDLEYRLKAPDIKSYVGSLYDRFALNDFFQARKEYRDFDYEAEHLINVFVLFAQRLKMTLREVEQLFSRIYLAILSTKVNIFLYPALLTTLIVIRDKQREIYDDYIQPTSTPEKIIEYLYTLAPHHELINTFEFALIEGYLINAKLGRHEAPIGESLQKHINITEDSNSSNDEKSYSERVISIAQNAVRMGRSVVLESVIDRIELLEQFNFTWEKES